MSADFEAALDEALAHHKRRAQRAVAMVVGVWLVALAIMSQMTGTTRPLMRGVALLAVMATVFLLRNVSSAGLAKLRGGQPLLWAPSPTHGVLVVTEKVLVAGGLAELPLDRSAPRRCDGAGYDEDTHELIVQEVTANREGEPRSTRHRVKLAPSVTPAQGLALSLRVTQLAAR